MAHWIDKFCAESDGREDRYLICSECKAEYYKKHNFCPKCGARMTTHEKKEDRKQSKGV